MKKLISLTLAGALCLCALSGCSRRSGTDEADPPVVAATPEPQPMLNDGEPAVGAHGETYQSLDVLPTLEPVQRIDDEDFSMDGLPPAAQDSSLAGDDAFATLDSPISSIPVDSVLAPPTITVIDPNTFQFSALTDTQLGFTFNYPTQWENLPGIYTVCFRERTENGVFPARVSITRKKLNHTVEDKVLNQELKEFVRVVARQYAASSFQLGTASSAETFLGRAAISDTYLAYAGDTEVKGYIIGTSVGMYLVVFHFCAPYDEYVAMENVMKYMVRSVQAAG